MIIHILCNDGSPLGIHYSDIFGNEERIGIGGAELALLTLAEAWVKMGHSVVLYNNPKHLNKSPFEQASISSFNKHDKRDILIIFRSPTQKVLGANGKIVWFSTDQYTIGDFKHFAQFCDSIVTISKFHAKYFAETYEIRETEIIDIPVRTWEYENQAEKIPNRLIFTSVPDRGLWQVSKVFPKIKEAIPDATLVITSDYRLWGTQSPNNQQFVQLFMRQAGAEFLGAVPRRRLIEEQKKAQIHLYPGVYDELFCISVAESQVAGALPITSTTGALETTNMGVLIDGNPNDTNSQKMFVQKTIEYLQNPFLPQIQKELQEKALRRFSLENILRQWDERIFYDC